MSKDKYWGIVKSKIQVFVLLYLTINTVPAFAQEQPPTDIDLKAAYCLGLQISNIEMFSSSFSDSEPIDSTFKTLTESLKDGAIAKRRRLQLYLTTRLPYIDVSGLTAALKAEKEDGARYDNVCKECQPRLDSCDKKVKYNHKKTKSCIDEWKVCDSTCFPGYREKMKSCNDLSFLPY